MPTQRSSRLLRLRRGTQVRARPDGLLQVGTDPGRRCLLPDTTAVRGLLHLLEHGVRAASFHELTPVSDALRRSGLLVAPEDDLLLARARAATRVHLDVPGEWLPELSELLGTAGLGRSEGEAPHVVVRSPDAPAGTPRRRSARRRGPARPAEPVPPEDPAVLHLSLVDARVQVGPFVVPGRTACPGCVEAHLRAEDPASGGGTAAVLHAGEPDCEELDALLRRAAFTSAVQDVVAWAEGRQPLTWSTVRWFDASQRVESRRWDPHPACSCAWDSPSAPGVPGPAGRPEGRPGDEDARGRREGAGTATTVG